MASQNNADNSNYASEADMAQAFKDLARGERTASAMEQHLTAIESRINELLKRADEDQKRLQSERSACTSSSPAGVNGDNNHTQKTSDDHDERNS